MHEIKCNIWSPIMAISTVRLLQVTVNFLFLLLSEWKLLRKSLIDLAILRLLTTKQMFNCGRFSHSQPLHPKLIGDI